MIRDRAAHRLLVNRNHGLAVRVAGQGAEPARRHQEAGRGAPGICSLLVTSAARDARRAARSSTITRSSAGARRRAGSP